jgi:hypothetical protein
MSGGSMSPSLEEMKRVVEFFKKQHVPIKDTHSVVYIPEEYYLDLLNLDTSEDGKEVWGQ